MRYKEKRPMHVSHKKLTIGSYCQGIGFFAVHILLDVDEKESDFQHQLGSRTYHCTEDSVMRKNYLNLKNNILHVHVYS